MKLMFEFMFLTVFCGLPMKKQTETIMKREWSIGLMAKSTVLENELSSQWSSLDILYAYSNRKCPLTTKCAGEFSAGQPSKLIRAIYDSCVTLVLQSKPVIMMVKLYQWKPSLNITKKWIPTLLCCSNPPLLVLIKPESHDTNLS